MSKDLSSTELAEERTDWAEDRTILANERTFAGWLRTGMASLAVAIGLHAVFRSFEPTWVAKAASLLFVAIAIIIFIVARSQACRTLSRLHKHQAIPLPAGRLTMITYLLVLAAIGTGAILWFV
jgi:putative membrane protein